MPAREVTAEFKDGVLTVHLSKTEKARPKQIEVKSSERGEEGTGYFPLFRLMHAMRLYLINPSNPLVSMVNVNESRWNRYRVWKPLSLMVLAG